MSTAVRLDWATATIEHQSESSASISVYLSRKNVPPTQAWLDSFLPSIRPNTAQLAAQQTALFRILATDITTSVDSSRIATLPADIFQPEVREQRLTGTILVQLMDIEDIGRSRWSQVEVIESQERGETTKGREIIRVVPDENFAVDAAVVSSGPHKLLFQDTKGTKTYGLELETVKGIGAHMPIGSKLVLKDPTVARGVIMLQPGSVEILGGKVDAWDRKWRNERKGILKQKAGMTTIIDQL